MRLVDIFSTFVLLYDNYDNFIKLIMNSIYSFNQSKAL